MESIESSTPPLPGIALPESFTSVDRLMADSIRSPIFAVKATQIDKISIATTEILNENKMRNRSPAAAVNKNPLMNPTILLFGLTINGFADFLPNRDPTTKARESFVKIKIKNNRINFPASGKLEIRTA